MLCNLIVRVVNQRSAFTSSIIVTSLPVIYVDAILYIINDCLMGYCFILYQQIFSQLMASTIIELLYLLKYIVVILHEPSNARQPG